MAEKFVASHPPNHGWLSAYGADFPDFVAQYRPAADLGYLADVARIEWARVRAANAPDTPALDLLALARMDSEALESLPLNLHVAASLVYSPFGAACQAAALEEEDYDLASRLGDLVCMRALARFTA